ncbi:uncharacterized protein BT62DRAFT_547269 [Guyanagaster necrorhizus]|uniref:Uncharacterized protein n=1 Tax=Guyanagaster necrorhizus TaxID=856835 RepID=A0A9P7VHR3_9AGAR|nr:uncharacterized protein BT62DRAFT_547269 [Guyanagaster necrorhizus MCA 3950]KAG7441268.1 hypothetical protein BT62DRAFT_547269 [Guyanagaster necrorhizus MCA 3950]
MSIATRISSEKDEKANEFRLRRKARRSEETLHVRYSTPHHTPKHPGNSEGRTEGLEQEGKRILRPCTSTAS